MLSIQGHIQLISGIRRAWMSIRRTLAKGKPARWSFDKEVQDFKIGISCQMEKKNDGGQRRGNVSDNLAIFSGNQKQGLQKKEVKYRRLGDGAGGTTIRKGLRKAVSVIW